MLSLLMLGSPQILRDQQPVARLRRKSRALLYYVATQDRSVTRDHLLALFWPDLERAAGQQNLRTTLSNLRRRIGTTLLTEDDRVTVTADASIDTRLFEARLARRAPGEAPNVETLSSALALYRGDFLADFHLPNSPEFNDWIAIRREHFQHLAIHGLTFLSQIYEENRDYPAALETLLRAVAFDPLQEDLQRACIRLHYLAGDRPAAIHRYDVLRKLLDEELGIPPMAQTRALYDAIINDSLPIEVVPPVVMRGKPSPDRPGTASTAPLPFTGRALELKSLEQAARSRKLIVVEGEPGIGKTRLIEEFIRRRQQTHEEKSSLILRGIAHEMEQGLPYQPIIGAVRGLLSTRDWPALRAGMDLAPAWLAEATRLVPELAGHLPATPSTGPITDESRLWESLSQLLLKLAAQRQVIVFLDDLQWADPSTLALLGYLARRATSNAVLLMGTLRPVAMRSKLAQLLQALTHEERLFRLPLYSLSAPDMIALAEHFSPTNSYALYEWFMRNSEGNPYFLTSLVRYAFNKSLLSSQGRLDVDALATTVVVPQTVHNLIQSRLAHLSEEAQRVLEIAAVVGREFDFQIVERSALLSEASILDALDELRAAVFIYPRDGDLYAFDHSLTREVVYRQMGEPRYRALHRHVAETLERIHHRHLDEAAGLLAFHFSRGNAPQRAASYALRAGQRAVRIAAWAEAIDFFEQVLSAGDDDAQRCAAYTGLGNALLSRGEPVQASEAFFAALRLAQALEDLPTLETVHLRLNLSLLPQMRYAEALELAQAFRTNCDPELVITAEFMLGTALSLEGSSPSQAESHLREAARLLDERADQPSLISRAMVKYQLAGAVGQQGDHQQAIELYREALALADENKDALELQRHILAYNDLAYYLYRNGDTRAAAETVRAGLVLAQEKGSLTHQPYLFSTSGEIALAENKLDDAEKFFNEGLALAKRLSLEERVVGLTANLGLLARQRGDTDLAIQHLRSALHLADQYGRGHLSARIRLWLAPLVPAGEARSYLRQARSIAEQNGYRDLVESATELQQSLSLD